MIDLKELDKTIKYLNELKKKEEEKQLEELKEVIENELKRELEDVLMHFESQALVNFINTYERDICFDYNGFEILKEIKDKINVDVWEVN